jgi:hypothetical protein
MNGMSDVRLTLHSQELEARGARADQRAAGVYQSLGLFWRRRHTRKAIAGA